MRQEPIAAAEAFDWKGAGYLVSIVSVLFLGSVAWPKPGEPRWTLLALLAGMGTSMIGMAMRYVAHLKQQKELRRAKAQARKS